MSYKTLSNSDLAKKRLNKKKRQRIQKKRDKENTQSKNHKSFSLNEVMIHHILKLTIEQPRKAYFKTNYRTAEEDLF